MTAAAKTRTAIIACPHGFCAGVVRAVAMANSILKKLGPPVYCLNEIVHNQFVVRDLESRGMVFVPTAEDIPDGAVALFSAHGVSPQTRQLVQSRARHVFDATCPFVKKVHEEVKRYASQGMTIFMIGRPNHAEVKGVVGESPDDVVAVADSDAAHRVQAPNPDKVAVVMQTTLSVDDARDVLTVLRQRFPKLQSPKTSDICYATQNRQQAVRQLAMQTEFIVVLGSHNSSNSNRLVEVAAAAGRKTVLVNSLTELDAVDLSSVSTLGLTAGASTPESFVEEVAMHLHELGFEDVHSLETTTEDMVFSMPPELE